MYLSFEFTEVKEVSFEWQKPVSLGNVSGGLKLHLLDSSSLSALPLRPLHW